MMGPLRFVSYSRPMVWGGRGLNTILGKHLPTDDPYGEAWEVSDHASHHSVVSSGNRAGRTLADLMQHDRVELLGKSAANYSTFPWLIKYLDACDWLSVQVHPCEKTVGRLWPGENSKTEAWFILGAAPGSRVYAGLKPGVGEAELRAALERGDVADCLHQFQPSPGDCLFLPAGTVHAVGGGVLMAEIQQTSDATFRLFDWNRRDAQGRSRTLHIEESIAAIHWDAGPVSPVHASGYPENGNQKSTAPSVRQKLVSCRYFELEYIRHTEPVTLGGLGKMQMLMVAHGQGQLNGGAKSDGALHRGETLLLPASVERTALRPQGSIGILLATLPEAG